jgi:transposase
VSSPFPDLPKNRAASPCVHSTGHAPNDILRFVDDLTVPPTSNDAERGLRPSKIQQKISGRLTSIPRTEDRYRILGYITTAAKHGLDQFKTLLDVFLGHIWIPDGSLVSGLS